MTATMLESLRRLGWLGLAVSSMVLVGCGAAEDAASDGVDVVAEQAGLTGEWSGTWQNESGSGGVARFHVEQKGLSIVGTVTLENNPCFRVATLRGGIEGAKVVADLDFGRAHLKYEASLFDGTEMTGLYETVLHGGACENHRGVLSLVK